MKKALLASAAVAALGLAGISQGAIIASGSDKDITWEIDSVTPPVPRGNPGAPNPAGTNLTGYTGYILRFKSSAGLMTGIDLSVTRRLTGHFHQRWLYDPDEEVATFTPGGAGSGEAPHNNMASSTSPWNFDTHFMGTAMWVVPPGIAALNEDNDLVTTPLAQPSAGTSKYGRGTFLNGAAGFSINVATIDFAYLVIKDSDLMSLFAKNVQVAYQNQPGGTPATFDIFIPEPASLSLLGLVGLIACRRR